MTLLLTRSDVTALLDVDRALHTLTTGFRTAAPDDVVPGDVVAQRIRTDLPGPGTATVLIPGLLPGIDAYTVKVNAKFPAAAPALRGVICLHSLTTGELLALMDSASVTAWRTGLAAALATHTLALPGARTLGFVGAGAQAAMTWAGLRRLRTWDTVVATDLDPARAATLGTPLPTATDVAAAADVVVLATWSRTPLLQSTRDGQHLTSLGADEPGKTELSRSVLETSRVIVDDLTLVTTSGALGTAGLAHNAATGTLSDVLRGVIPAHVPGPSVYTPVGLPWQDLALAWDLYTAATHTHTGTPVDLLA